MTYSIADLGADLLRLGWRERHVAFGRQSWEITTNDGHAEVEMHVQGDGLVGSFRLLEHHPADEDEEAWEEDRIVLEVLPVTSPGTALRIHRTETEVAGILHRYAEVLAATVEP